MILGGFTWANELDENIAGTKTGDEKFITVPEMFDQRVWDLKQQTCGLNPHMAIWI